MGAADWDADTWQLVLDTGSEQDASALAVIQGWLDDPASNLGVRFNTDAGQVYYAYGSGADADFRPTLILETAPEPCTFLSVVAGWLLLATGRRRIFAHAG